MMRASRRYGCQGSPAYQEAILDFAASTAFETAHSRQDGYGQGSVCGTAGCKAPSHATRALRDPGPAREYELSAGLDIVLQSDAVRLLQVLPCRQLLLPGKMTR